MGGDKREGVRCKMSNTRPIVILGGGPAGLAAGYYARKSGMSFRIHEASAAVGGNCRTIGHKEFLFDTGAHRLHDRDSDITLEMRDMLGERLRKIHVPSRIFSEGNFIDFPLTPLNLWKRIGAKDFIASSWEVIKARMNNSVAEDFKSLALRAYGTTIAERFLLNYSEKLWGLPCEQLSANIAGRRLKGLDLRTFLLEAIAGGKAKTRHIDGEFWYPRQGIGEIFSKVEEKCGQENICLHSRVTRIFHDNDRVTAIELNNSTREQVSEVISSLPVPLLARMMEPAIPAQLLEAASSLRFRHVLLVCFFIDKPSVTRDATIYFPSRSFAFTRVYEPRNRSPQMSPQGKTSLIAEIPCFTEDNYWNDDQNEVIRGVKQQLLSTGLVQESEIVEAITYKVPYAYPVLEKGIEKRLQPLHDYFSGFSNLHEAGRSGMFRYTHIHDMFARGKEIIDQLKH